MKERIQWIDSMRGFTMLLVVSYHVSLICLSNEQTTDIVSIHHFFRLFRMPLFFAISGYFFNSPRKTWFFKDCVQIILNKSRIQLLPTITFIIIAIAFQITDLKSVIKYDDKGGYWFTFVLYIYFVLFTFIQLISTILKNKYSTFIAGKNGNLILIIIGSILIYFISNKGYLLESPLNHLLSLSYWTYFPFFCFGAIIRNNETIYNRILDNEKLTTLMILLMLVLGPYLIISKITIHNSIISILYFIGTGIMGIMLCMKFFKKNEIALSNSTFVGIFLQNIGQKSLDIYLLHYFFLPWALKNYNVAFIRQNIILDIIISFSISILIVYLCLIVSRIIRLSPLLGKICFAK